MVQPIEKQQLILVFENHKERKIQVDQNSYINDIEETISQLEELQDGTKLYLSYKNQQLDQDKQLNYYNLPPKCKLHITLKTEKTRSFKATNIKGDQIKKTLGSYDPNYHYLSAKRGLNFLANCKICQLDVCIQIGEGFFDVSNKIGKQKCSKCGEGLCANDIKNFIFSNQCYWKYELQLQDSNTQDKGQGKNEDENGYTTFIEGDKANYCCLNIFCDRDDAKVKEYEFD